MICDVITYNGEKDLFDLRYNILKDWTDEFIVCESPTTFTGKPKPLYFEQIKDKYPEVRYYVNDENYSPEELALASSSPNTKGAPHWQREFLQKERIKDALKHLKDDDIVFIGDCDEIRVPTIRGVFGKLRLRVYPYYLNNESDEVFYGTLVAPHKMIKNECLNHLRTDAPIDKWFSGWHFTSQGGEEEVRRKLNDSYTSESYNTELVQNNLKTNIEQRKDYIGRNFEMRIDESNWPEYLKNNREKYKHLLYENRTC